MKKHIKAQLCFTTVNICLDSLLPLAAEHKASARKGVPAAAPSSGPTREQLRAVQSRVDEFVMKASELLEIERAAEVEATKRALDGAEMPVEEEDRDNSLRKIVVVRSYTGGGSIEGFVFLLTC